MDNHQSIQHNENSVRTTIWKFEATWADARMSGQPGPDPVAFLVEAHLEESGRDLACGLASIDLEHRLKLGKKARVDNYVGMFPGVNFGIEEMHELILTEYAGLLFQGDDPAPNTYRERFPEQWTGELCEELCRLRRSRK